MVLRLLIQIDSEGDSATQSDTYATMHTALQRWPPAAGFEVFNDTQLASLRPIALRLFSAPSSYAASERVFSQSGLIMKPTRSRLSKNRLAQLVFLKCNNHLK